MAISIRGFLRNNLKFLTSSIQKPITINARSIFSAEALSIDSYTLARKNILNQFDSVSQTFRDKMSEYVKEDNKSLIFTEDVKAMCHIVQGNKEDVDLMLKMIKKFHAQNNELRFGNYVLGPVVMRAFYYLDMPDVAVEAFKDPELQGMFEQLTSYQVLLTLLYNHNRYSEMREIYDLIKQRYSGGILHPMHSIMLILAAAYKENTPESFTYALDLWKDVNEKGFEPNRRVTCLLAGLALKQGRPEFALELISSCSQWRHIEVRCIKIQAYAELNRLHDVAMFIRKMLNSERFNKDTARKITFFKDTIQVVEEILNNSNKEENIELVKILDELKSHNLIQETTLEESLTRPIERRAPKERLNNRKFDKFSGPSEGRRMQGQRTEMRY